MTRPFFCYSASYIDNILWPRNRNATTGKIIPLYVRLYRKKDGEAWRVNKAFCVDTPWPPGTQLTYRDNSIRDFGAIVISKAEYETFKFFENEGKEWPNT